MPGDSNQIKARLGWRASFKSFLRCSVCCHGWFTDLLSSRCAFSRISISFEEVCCCLDRRCDTDSTLPSGDWHEGPANSSYERVCHYC